MSKCASTGSTSKQLSRKLSAVDPLRTGQIQFGATVKSLNQQQKEMVIVNMSLYNAIPIHQINIGLHSYLLLEFTDGQIGKLELKCSKNEQEVQVTYKRKLPNTSRLEFVYTLETQSDLTMEDVLLFIEQQFVNTTYLYQLNDCQIFCYSIIKQFCTSSPRHSLVLHLRVNNIYFCLSDVPKTFGLVKRGYIVLDTSWAQCKIEIIDSSGTVQLNTEITHNDTYVFQATSPLPLQLFACIEESKREWTRKKYGTISNNSFDFCKFIMNTFTSDYENVKKIDIYETEIIEIRAVVVGGLSGLGSSFSLGAYFSILAGPGSILMGSVIGIVIGSLL